MKNIYKFEKYFRRMGTLEGIFFATPEEVQKVIGKEVYFGEALGKHSEISCVIGWDNISLLSDDQDFNSKAEKIFGGGTVSGKNPLRYYEENQEGEEDDNES